MREIMKKANLNWKNLAFDYVKTNCHLEFYFKNGKWDDGTIVKDDKITLDIAATCINYGQECFEGIKVFESKDKLALIFRVEENAKRMAKSAKKLLMPPFPPEKFIDAVFKIVRLNQDFLPPYGSGASLYIRPLQLGISPLLGVKPSREYLFLVFCTPVGPYFKSGLKPIKLIVEKEFDRAAPGGVGDIKAGGNYAAGLRATMKAQQNGFTEVLYLDPAQKKYIDESGPANFFGITKDNKYITPDSKSILKSITNMSLMQLAKDKGLTVEKRPVEINEIFNFVEAGCCGTAAVITPIESITYDDQIVTYCKDGITGPICNSFYKTLTSIQMGEAEDPYEWVKEILLH
jgi:branched-chain amino acid aminotransferase